MLYLEMGRQALTTHNVTAFNLTVKKSILKISKPSAEVAPTTFAQRTQQSTNWRLLLRSIYIFKFQVQALFFVTV